MPIHPSALIDPAARIDPSADIGAYVVIDGPVGVGPGVRIFPFAYLTGWTEIEADCQIHPNAVIGHLPQDFHFTGERSYCRIGRGTVIREGVTIHRATTPEGATVIGRECQFLCGTHVGHDVVIGDRVTLIPFAAVAGHAHIGDGAVLSAHAGIHQFCRVGELAMIGGGGMAVQDVPPFLTLVGRNRCVGVNVVGMRRAGLPREDIDEVRRLYRAVYRTDLPQAKALASVRDGVRTASGRKFISFFDSPSRRGIVHAPHRLAGRSDDGSGGL